MVSKKKSNAGVAIVALEPTPAMTDAGAAVISASFPESVYPGSDYARDVSREVWQAMLEHSRS